MCQAVLSGGDWCRDPVVVRLALKHHLTALAGLGEASRQIADDLVTAGLADAANGLLASFAAALQEPTEALVNAVSAGIVDLTDTPAGATAATYQLWLDARSSNELFNTVISAAMTLMRCSHVGTECTSRQGFADQ